MRDPFLIGVLREGSMGYPNLMVLFRCAAGSLKHVESNNLCISGARWDPFRASLAYSVVDV